MIKFYFANNKYIKNGKNIEQIKKRKVKDLPKS